MSSLKIQETKPLFGVRRPRTEFTGSGSDLFASSQHFPKRSLLPKQLQGKLDDTRGLAGLDDRLRRRRGHRGAAGLREDRRAEARASDRSVARVVEVRVVQGVEHLRAKLERLALRNLEPLAERQIQVC